MNMRSRTLRNTLHSSVGMYTEYALGMLTSVIIARHLGPDDFGVYSVVLWLVVAGLTSTNSGTATAVIRFAAEMNGAGNVAMVPAVVRYLRRLQRLFMVVVLLVIVVAFVLAGKEVAPDLDRRLLLAFLAVAIGLRASYMFNIGVIKGFENFRALAAVALVAAPVNLAMVLVAWWLDASVEGLLLVYLLSSILFFAVSRRVVAAHLRDGDPHAALPEPFVARMRRHVRITAMIVTVGFFAASEVEVLFLSLYAGYDAAGMFKVAYQLSTGMVALVPGVFGALLLPMMARAIGEGNGMPGRRLVATTGYLWLLSAPLIAFGVVLSAPLIEVLYGPAYAAAAPVFAICIFATAFNSSTMGASSLLISADRQGSLLVMFLAYLVVKLVLDMVLIQRFGLMGGAVAYMVVATATAVARLVHALRPSRAAPPGGRRRRPRSCCRYVTRCIRSRPSPSAAACWWRCTRHSRCCSGAGAVAISNTSSRSTDTWPADGRSRARDCWNGRTGAPRGWRQREGTDPGDHSFRREP